MNKKVDAYLDAVAGYRAIKQAIEDEGETPNRLRSLKEAKDAATQAYGRLTGREAWLATYTLAHPKEEEMTATSRHFGDRVEKEDR